MKDSQGTSTSHTRGVYRSGRRPTSTMLPRDLSGPVYAMVGPVYAGTRLYARELVLASMVLLRRKTGTGIMVGNTARYTVLKASLRPTCCDASSKHWGRSCKARQTVSRPPSTCNAQTSDSKSARPAKMCPVKVFVSCLFAIV